MGVYTIQAPADMHACVPCPYYSRTITFKELVYSSSLCSHNSEALFLDHKDSTEFIDTLLSAGELACSSVEIF